MRTRRHRPPEPLDVDRTLAPFVRGGGDPTSAHGGDGWWFAWTTPAGPVTLHVGDDGGEVLACAWGPGADWMLDRLPDLLGGRDDPSGFTAHHDLVARGWPRMSGWRVPANGLVAQMLVCSVIEQKVTGREAFSSLRQLVRRFGTPAPGPGEARGLVAPPSPAQWARIPSWDWVRAGVDGSRSRTVVTAMRAAGRLDECAGLPLEEAHRRIRSLPGIGVWTDAEVAQRALGDADSPSFGDYHVAKDVTLALDGVVGDDARMAQLLAPYAGQRYRAQRVITAAAGPRPRRGPRRSLPGHLPTRW
ncbi:DNA-3-methyladenine glycosylase 2 family protein [Janibacter cremeus]|uniref:3-methyladenine DNA glycosylase/8-oxoguanine DNA glycosylase n=1 Tax=Janibacter cremeus TaxID=1285192 RepID=A0A852VY19_9MICO|nr:3-methyladenine DNA glycosylase/8-oxoguanine DNA glycosylase [Janibacter cremeus]